MTDVAPRITPEQIEDAIASEYYFTAREGVYGARHTNPQNPPSDSDVDALSMLTFCVLVLKNGFTVTGESAVVSPENFDAAVGRSVARQNAISKMWPLLGYAMKDKLYRG